jgi:triacylglycerol lipase
LEQTKASLDVKGALQIMQVHSTSVQPPLALAYGQFVQAAYDVYKADPGALNPTQADYPSFPAGYTLMLNIQMNDFVGSENIPAYYGFVAQSTATPGLFVMAVRGTESWQEWWDDFHWGLVPFSYMPNGGNVADGFLDIYETLATTVPGNSMPAALLKDTSNSLGGISLDAITSLIIVGHSLGGALVTLYAGALAAAGKINPKVYTLASPQVGDAAFVTAYNAAVATSYRIYNWPDLVPNFPKDPFDNYEHVKGGYEVDSLDHPLTVQISLECFHALVTYLFLLGAPPSILGKLRLWVRCCFNLSGSQGSSG